MGLVSSVFGVSEVLYKSRSFYKMYSSFFFFQKLIIMFIYADKCL